MKSEVRIMLPIVALAACLALTACSDEPAPISADVVGLLSGDAEGYARAFGPRAIVFPQDHGAHPAYQTEWWYYTGNLVARDAGGDDPGGDRRRFGFQLTVFRNALDPAPDAPDSAWGSGQAYLAHFALTDVQANTLHAAERLSRGDAGLAGAQAAPMRIWVETWEITEVADGANMAGASLGPRVRLRAADGDVSIDLVLTPRKAPVLHGDAGYSRKGPEPGNASFYYSLTRQRAEGVVTTAEGAFDVEGEAWMDHEWSTSALSEGQTGWDWLSLQLDDGREVMAFHIREADGGVAPASSGSVISPDGTVRHLDRDDFGLTPSGEWTSPRTRGRYPSAWRLDVPAEGLQLEVTPLIPDQELDLGIRYFEGAVRASGLDTRTGALIEGYGYLEMTGYAPSARGPNFLP